MSYYWTTPPKDLNTVMGFNAQTAPSTTLTLQAHNSLSPKGFVLFFGATCALMSMPLIVFLGSVFWYVFLCCFAITFGGAWCAIHYSWKRGMTHEIMDVWSDRIYLKRINADGTQQDWEANPYWVKAKTYETGGPVPFYVTLCGSGRTVEIGSFLSQEERKDLSADLQSLLNKLH